MSVCMLRRALTCRITGAVQGVGFRPFVHRLACELELDGWVRNDGDGVALRVEGSVPALEEFRRRVEADRPPAARIASIAAHEEAASEVDRGFVIRESDPDAPPRTAIMADLATCSDCLREIRDPADRRHRHPFTNCTNCGPRFSIVTGIPYDRPNTTMRAFAMCPACRAEYENPADRRFHAQPIACPACGPRLALWNPEGATLAERDDALRLTAEAIRAGRIVAIKGLGGFHLVCDARNDDAVHELRRRKRRDEKPFAVMFPTVADIEAVCSAGPLERDLLTSAQAPIVLLVRRPADSRPALVSHLVAPANPLLGALLPYTPLHHLLLDELRFPVVATSGNLSDEPICIDEHEALARLHGIADLYLVHNRRIARPVDDSVLRPLRHGAAVLRRSRGYAPLPVRTSVPARCDRTAILAVGGQMKNTLALETGGGICLSQHIGDLETERSIEAFAEAAAALPALYDTIPSRIACDLHPDYASTRWARAHCARPLAVQHHHAHILAVMAEHGLRGEVFGVAWDGTGFGADGTVWGGEFIVAGETSFRRFAHLRPFRLPGGEAAIREPRRCALGLAHAAHGDAAFDTDPWSLRGLFSAAEWSTLRAMLQRGVNCPITSSAGRLFDAVASLLGLRQRSAFEGQAAMLVEFAAARATSAPFPPAPPPDEAPVIDWQPMIETLVRDRVPLPTIGNRDTPEFQSLEDAGTGRLAAAFHAWLIASIVKTARRAALPRVCLGGGCFQNTLLLDGATDALRAAGFEVYAPREVPANDGGLALGQIWHALHAEDGS